MNNTRTTNILLSVILLVSIGNYLKTDSLGIDLVVQLEQMRIQQDIDLNDITRDLRDMNRKLDDIERYTGTAAYQ